MAKQQQLEREGEEVTIATSFSQAVNRVTSQRDDNVGNSLKPSDSVSQQVSKESEEAEKKEKEREAKDNER